MNRRKEFLGALGVALVIAALIGLSGGVIGLFLRPYGPYGQVPPRKQPQPLILRADSSTGAYTGNVHEEKRTERSLGD